MATHSAPDADRFRLFRNIRNPLIIHVHDRHRRLHYLHRFSTQDELRAYVSQLRQGCSVRVPDALLAIED